MGILGKVMDFVVRSNQQFGRSAGVLAKEAINSGDGITSIFKTAEGNINIKQGLGKINDFANILDDVDSQKLLKGMKRPEKTESLLNLAKDFKGGSETLKVGEKVVEKAAVEGAEGAAKTGLKGILKKLPIVGTAFTLLGEVPDLIDAKKNGDLGKQVGRSAINIGSFAAGTAAATAIGTAICPGIGTVAGFIVGTVGGLAGGKVGKTLGDAVFGKSIKEQKEEVAEQQGMTEEQMAALQQTGNQEAYNQTAYGINSDVINKSNDVMSYCANQNNTSGYNYSGGQYSGSSSQNTSIYNTNPSNYSAASSTAATGTNQSTVNSYQQTSKDYNDVKKRVDDVMSFCMDKNKSYVG